MKTEKKVMRSYIRKKIFLGIIIVFHILFSIFIWYRESNYAQERAIIQFEDKAIAESYDISQRLETYSDVLYSLRGMFADNSTITKYE
jgi:CHASE1-domain containing sensor protein